MWLPPGIRDSSSRGGGHVIYIQAGSVTWYEQSGPSELGDGRWDFKGASMQAVHEAEGKDTNLSMLWMCTLPHVGYLNAFLNVWQQSRPQTMKRKIVLSVPGSMKSETRHVEQYNYALGYVDPSDIHFRFRYNTNQLLYASIKDVLIDSKEDLWSTVSKQELNREFIYNLVGSTYVPVQVPTRYQLVLLQQTSLSSGYIWIWATEGIHGKQRANIVYMTWNIPPIDESLQDTHKQTSQALTFRVKNKLLSILNLNVGRIE